MDSFAQWEEISVNFAAGAVRAAAWVVGREARKYDMKDVLGLNDVQV